MTTSVKMPADGFGGRAVHHAVDRDDAAERRDGVAIERRLIGFGQRRAGRDAARVGVLDDGAGRAGIAEFGNEFERAIGIVEIVVAQFLALHLARRRNAATRRFAAGRALPAGAGFRHNAACPRGSAPAAARRGTVRPDRQRRTSWRPRHHRPAVCANAAAASRLRSARSVAPSLASSAAIRSRILVGRRHDARHRRGSSPMTAPSPGRRYRYSR